MTHMGHRFQTYSELNMQPLFNMQQTMVGLMSDMIQEQKTSNRLLAQIAMGNNASFCVKENALETKHKSTTPIPTCDHSKEFAFLSRGIKPPWKGLFQKKISPTPDLAILEHQEPREQKLPQPPMLEQHPQEQRLQEQQPQEQKSQEQQPQEQEHGLFQTGLFSAELPKFELENAQENEEKQLSPLKKELQIRLGDGSSFSDKLSLFFEFLTSKESTASSIGECWVKPNSFERVKYYNRLLNPQSYIDSRETKIKINFIERLKQAGIFKISSSEEIKNFMGEWLGLVYRSTASICWNFLRTKTLSFEETKILFTENILFNYIELMKDINSMKDKDKVQSEMTADEMELICTEAINKESFAVLKYLVKQYPQTKIDSPNIALRESLPSINEKGKIQYDLIYRSKVRFKRRPCKTYAPEIMQFINYLIHVTDEEYDIYEYKTRQFFQSLYKMKSRLLNSEEYEERNNEQIERIKKYTSFTVGRKIPRYTPKYTKEEIHNAVFFIKEHKIIRIISKWVEQLTEIVEKPEKHILECFYPFKTHDGKEYHPSYIIRSAIYNAIIEKRDSLFDELREIKRKCYEIAGNLIEDRFIMADNLDHLSDEQINVGLFASNIKNGMASYLYMQLKELIHFLIEIPLDIDEQKLELAETQLKHKARAELDSINLISCRIFDLLRCKCSSGEKEIISLIIMLKEALKENSDLKQNYGGDSTTRQIGRGIFALSRKPSTCSSPRRKPKEACDFLIVRVKDRLAAGTRDVLVNLQIGNGIITEMQLSINSRMEEKEQMLDKYNHFLYELRRSTILGPLIENVSIWTSLEQRAGFFDEITKKRYLDYSNKPSKSQMLKLFHSTDHGAHNLLELHFLLSRAKNVPLQLRMHELRRKNLRIVLLFGAEHC